MWNSWIWSGLIWKECALLKYFIRLRWWKAYLYGQSVENQQICVMYIVITELIYPATAQFIEIRNRKDYESGTGAGILVICQCFYFFNQCLSNQRYFCKLVFFTISNIFTMFATCKILNIEKIFANFWLEFYSKLVNLCSFD